MTAQDQSESPITFSNGRTDLTLDDLGVLLPGLARLMMEVSPRVSRCYHAAKAKNARLARFELSEGIKILKLCTKIRPQYAEAIDRFIEQDLGKVRATIEAEDWDGFDKVWADMTDEVNRNHAEFDHGFLVWKVDEQPPGDLDLTPPAK